MRRVEEESGSSGGEEASSPRPHHHHALVHHPSMRRHDGDEDHSDVNDDEDADEEKHGKLPAKSVDSLIEWTRRLLRSCWKVLDDESSNMSLISDGLHDTTRPPMAC